MRRVYPRNIIAEFQRPLAQGNIVLHLPYPPSTNNLFQNGNGGGRPATKAYKSWQAEAGHCVLAARCGRINGPVEIDITFKIRNGRSDLDNIAKAPIDLLVKLGVIDGDDSRTLRKLTLSWGDVGGARVEIRRAYVLTAERAA